METTVTIAKKDYEDMKKKIKVLGEYAQSKSILMQTYSFPTKTVSYYLMSETETEKELEVIRAEYQEKIKNMVQNNEPNKTTSFIKVWIGKITKYIKDVIKENAIADIEK